VGSCKDDVEHLGESVTGEDASGDVMPVTDERQLPKDSQEFDRDVATEDDIGGIESVEGIKSTGVGVLQSGDCSRNCAGRSTSLPFAFLLSPSCHSTTCSRLSSKSDRAEL
jgi:hypothetical protein